MRTEGGHYYTKTGEAMHFVPKKDGTGNRPTTLADAKKLGLLPGVTQILKVLDKPALREWLIRQAVYAVVTSPDVDGEGLDAKITRVLEQERQQDEESEIARDRGTEIHAALEDLFCGKPISPEIEPWVRPAFDVVWKYGELAWACTEKILVGDGYAGKTDLIQLAKDCWWLWDWKSAKKLPEPAKGAWSEHRLQAAAYAAAWQPLADSQSPLPIRTGNIYISTVDCGKFVVCEHPDWQQTYDAFAALLKVWQWQNSYTY